MAVRDAKTGHFVSEDEADKNPDTTVTETSSKAKAAAKPKTSSKAKAAAKPKTSEKSQSKLHYYKSRLHGLSIVVRQDMEDHDPTTGIEKVRFVPYSERWQGDDIKVGYLATDNPVAIERLKTDPSVEELTKDEFEQATDTERSKNPAKRAAY